MADDNPSPWANGHSIDVLRQVSAGLTSNVHDYTATPVDAGGVAAEWIVAQGVTEQAPSVLYFHGGAYLCGHPEQYRNATVWLSRTVGVRVLVPDYRLAPEHPFPAAFEDALTAYRWLLDQAGADPKHLVVAGDSAGAGLAVSLVADAREQGLRLPACIVANSPYVDMALASLSLDDPERNVDEPNKVTIQWLAATYLGAGCPQGDGADPKDPRHSPVYRDLSGLPPLLVQTAGRDNLQHDGIRLAAQARSCGVQTAYTDYPAAGHIWIVMQPADQDADAASAMREMGVFIQRHIRDE